MSRDFTFDAGPISARWRRYGLALTLSARIGSCYAAVAVSRPREIIPFRNRIGISVAYVPKEGTSRRWLWWWPR